MSEIESMTPEDLETIRATGSRIIRNLSLFMDNPFSYAHLVEVCQSDLKELYDLKQSCGLKGDGLLPAQPLGQSQPDLAGILLDAGFNRLRTVVDDLISTGGNDNE
jgi:hypothetical protein